MTVQRGVVTIDASEPIEKINEIIARDGGVIVSNFLSSDLLQECLAAIEPHFDSRGLYTSDATHKELGKEFFSPGSKRVYGLLGKIPDQLVKILRSPVWNGIMERFLSDKYAAYTGDTLVHQKSGYMLNTTTAIRLVPGAKEQPLHRDHMAFQLRPDPNNPLFNVMVGCLIAASKTTVKNGATRVIPGSHLWAPDRAPKLEEAVYAEMEPGSALFTLGSTYHAGSANLCEENDPLALRTLFAVFGQRDYFRQQQDEVHSTPVEVARKLPDDILRITGYYKAVGGVGYVGDHQGPIDFLYEDGHGFGKMGPKDHKGATNGHPNGVTNGVM